MGYDKVKYNNDYNKNNYDRCTFNVPKGHKEAITAFYKARGYSSLNSYINALIEADMASHNPNRGGMEKYKK